MILIAVTIIALQERGYKVEVNLHECGLTFLGAFIILFTFIYDYFTLK